VIFSGNANNGTLDGTFYLNGNNSTSNSNSNIGDSALLKNDLSLTFPCPLVKRKSKTPLCVGTVMEDSGVTRQ
jgi:hypothetical protein